MGVYSPGNYPYNPTGNLYPRYWDFSNSITDVPTILVAAGSGGGLFTTSWTNNNAVVLNYGTGTFTNSIHKGHSFPDIDNNNIGESTDPLYINPAMSINLFSKNYITSIIVSNSLGKLYIVAKRLFYPNTNNCKQ